MKKKVVCRWANWAINHGFGMSMDAFLKSVKKFLDKEVRIMPFNNRSRSPPYPSIPQSFVMFYFTMPGYIFGIVCHTTLQVQEKLISRLPVEICCTITLLHSFFFKKNVVFPAQAEHSYFAADFWLNIFMYYSELRAHDISVLEYIGGISYS